MTNKTDAILKQALELSHEEREEIARRVAAIDAGAVQTIRWDAVRDRLHSRLAALLIDSARAGDSRQD